MIHLSRAVRPAFYDRLRGVLEKQKDVAYCDLLSRAIQTRIAVSSRRNDRSVLARSFASML